jgi:hypothetical protein
MRSRCSLRFTLALFASAICGHAIAAPVVYEFSGYFTDRTTTTSRMPASFSPNVAFTGTVTVDPARIYFDPETAEEIPSPVAAITLRSAAGDEVAVTTPFQVGGFHPQTVDGSEGFHVWAAGDANTGSDAVRTIALTWSAPGLGQVPADRRQTDLAALQPNNWSLHVSGVGQNCFPECSGPPDDVVNGRIVVLRRSWDDGLLSQFTNGAPGWTPQSGTWIADDGTYRNTTNQIAAISLRGIAAGVTFINARDYTIDARLRLQWSASGNRGGLVYDYVDARNYRAVLLSVTNPTTLSPGALELIEVVNGARRSVAKSGPVVLSPGEWGEIGISRVDGITRVRATDRNQPFLMLAQPNVEQPRAVGVIASWNLVRFDDVVVRQERTGGS